MNSNFSNKFAAQIAQISFAAVLMVVTSGAPTQAAQSFAAAKSLSSEPQSLSVASAAQVQRSWGGASAPAVSLTEILSLNLKLGANAPAASALQARRSWGGASAPATTSSMSLGSQATVPMTSALQARGSWGGAPAPATTSLTSLEPQDEVRGNEPAASALQVRRSWGGASAPAIRHLFVAAGAAVVDVTDDKTNAKSQNKTKDTVPNVTAPDDPQVFELMYENFRRTYRLGPADEIAVRVRLEPDYSIDRAKISPDGRVFHPLLGDVVAGGLTVEQLTKKLKQDLLRYIKQPEVSVQLLEAKSAKVGVLGEVGHPGILLMSGPMTVLDAITQAGGFARTGSRSNVSLVRQSQTGKYQTLNVDVKKLLAGKADAEENLPLQPGDTVIVHGNFLKKLEYVTALTGFTQFLTFVALTR